MRMFRELLEMLVGLFGWEETQRKIVRIKNAGKEVSMSVWNGGL